MPEQPPAATSEATTDCCPACGARVRPGAPCSQCLMRLATVSEDSMLLDSLHGRRFGDYELLVEIARGGMGVVFRARQISLEREVALKMIISGELAGEEALRMFRVEARAAANLHHPNIVPVYEIGEHEMQNYFTMRYVPGGQTIAEWAEHHRENFREIASAMAKVARALAHAHERGVLHRDLKPSNILWDPSGEPQVTDFGLAKLLDDTGGKATSTGMLLGSPCYMAPEQVGGLVDKITTATDVYGLGAILYELLSGHPPFTGKSVLDIARQIHESSPKTLTAVPLDLRTVCVKCLAKKPADRYATAQALAEDLERFAKGEPVTAVPLQRAERVWRWAQRKPALALLAALCIVSILAGSTGILWQWRAAARANKAQAAALKRMQWQEIDQWVERGEHARALAYLASLIRANPEHWQAVMYAMSIVDQHDFPILNGPVIQSSVRLVAPACMSLDGKSIVTAGADRIVRRWDVATGRQTAEWSRECSITAIGMTTGRNETLIATEDGALTLQGSQYQLVKVPRRFAAPILELQVSTDQSQLIARSSDGVETWAMAAISQRPWSTTLPDGVKGASISADGARLMAWNTRQASVYDTAAGKAVLQLSAVTSFRSGVLAADGARVAFLDGQFLAKIWDVSSGRLLQTVESPLAMSRFISLDREGSRLTVAGNANHLTVYDVESGIPVSPPMSHHYAIRSLQASPDGSCTVSYGDDDAIHVWDARTGASFMTSISFGKQRNLIHVQPSLNGTSVLLHHRYEGQFAESITVWKGDAQLPPKRHYIPGQRDFNSGRISPDGRLGCMGLNPENRAYVYELDTGRVVLDKLLMGDVYGVHFAPDHKKCYAVTANGAVYGWDLDTGQALWKPNQQPGKIRPSAISPDGTRLIAGHNDGHVRVYDTATGAVVQTLDHPGEVKVLRFAPDKSGRFMSASTDGIAHVWDLANGRKLQTFTGHSNTIIAGNWSPDSRFIATASYDSTARVWEVATGQQRGTPMNHFAWLSHLEFSPDGRRIVTACRDGTARLWNALSGQPLSPQLQQGYTCETVRFTSDGATFLVRDHEGFRFWDTENAIPVSIHYPEPVSGGLGMDSENWRAIMTPDGTRVFLGYSVNAGTLWEVNHPRGKAPPWFADLLETLCLSSLDETEPIGIKRGERVLELSEQLRRSDPHDFHANWAKHVLGLTGAR